MVVSRKMLKFMLKIDGNIDQIHNSFGIVPIRVIVLSTDANIQPDDFLFLTGQSQVTSVILWE